MVSAPHPSQAELEAFARHQLTRAQCDALMPHLQGCAVCRIALSASRTEAPDATIVEMSLSVDFSETLSQGGGTQSARFGPPEALIGKTVGDYVIEQALGLGGMGVVYKARHALIGKLVAIKVLRAEAAQEGVNDEALLAEARSAALIAHDSIVNIYAVGHLEDGRQYLVMEFLAGEPLNRVLKRETRLPLPKALEVIDRVLSALEAAHDAGIVHRDLKPSNLFLNSDRDGAMSVKLLDFGLARAPRKEGRGETRVKGLALGSPAYMSPEQVRGESVDQRADLYALGVLMYEMTTGQRPFRSHNLLELLTMQVETRPTPPRELEPRLSVELEQLILSLLEKKREKRPASATRVRTELRRLRSLSDPALQVEPTNRWLPALIIGSVIVFVVLAGLLLQPRPESAALQADAGVGAVETSAVSPVVAPTVAEVTPVEVPDAGENAAPADAGALAVEARHKLARKPEVRASLVERAVSLRRRIVASTPRGEEADPMALMLLKRTETEAANAHSQEDREKVEKMLRDIERNYLTR